MTGVIMKKKFNILCLLIILIISTSGCTSQEELLTKELEVYITNAQRSVAQLKDHIDKGLVKNTGILKMYADTVKNSETEFIELINALALDSTSRGPIYLGLADRLKTSLALSKSAPANGKLATENVAQELALISDAANPAIYNMMLTDPINVIADISNGKLPRIEALSKEASDRANGIADSETGNQLVGNPNYGNWQRRNDGTSFWAWYGMYSMFSNFGRPIYYSSWSNNRGYSYYNDYGRSHYTSPSQFKNQRATQATVKNKFQKSGKKFTSPYAKKRIGGSSTSAKPRPTKAKFSSAYKKSSSQSTTRNSSSRTSRSGRRGK